MMEKILKLVPEDPLDQSRFIYYLTVILFAGLLGYALFNWYTFIKTVNIGALFQALFMSAGALLSLTGVKQMRTTFMMMKAAYAVPKEEMKVESRDEMLGAFK